ncbi:MAG TPA: M23 family metallopeptidase [Lutibacter sp.]|nr:M23 family metallopeptidase [Lutibacter sp.]
MKNFLSFLFIFVVLFSCQNDKRVKSISVKPLPIIPEVVYEYGYNTNNFNVIKDTIRRNETLGIILDRHHIDYRTIHSIVQSVKDSFDLKKIQVGKPYTILSKKDTTQQAQVFIYQPNLVDYSIIDFKDSIITTKNLSKETSIRLETASGIIKSSLFETLESQDLNPLLAMDLSDIYAWTIDFYRIYKNDKFKVIYEQKYLEDSIPIGIGKIHAAYFEHNGTPFYSFNYLADSILGIPDYFDDESRNLRKAFLKSPIKFGRISSRYSMSRYVRIYGRHKPHLGTDFAAPVGTPIMSTANGTVIKSSYARGNGNYVKVKHNATYSTQYLHMQKRAVKVGDVVKQGQVIGYIGMTGSTTGPHVCYRFWKNGKQVDGMREKLPAAKPMPDSIKPHFFEFIKPLKSQLDSISYPKLIEEKVLQDSLAIPIANS